ncbi:MAG: hypothetical protein QF805_05170, partial [Pirellulaceae bacterium]|nr:hypothetical protein [Pirellulaceae bacterium]
FEVQTSAEPSYKEVKIDLPDSWVRGFLQVSSAMSLPAVACRLHPMDIHNICFALRRKKEVLGPRSLRYRLKPGEPVTVVLDPWGWEIPCPRSEYLGEQEHEIRVWGRRRLHILERLIPLARSFTVHLLGSGMPSFYVADLGDMSFTLGLSGWTANDWSASGNFDLLAPRGEVDTTTKERVFTALKENWRESPDALAARLQLDRATVLGALGAYSQAGRAIWDLEQNVYRARELSREPLAVSDLRFVNEREQAAQQFVDRGQALIARAEEGGGFVIISGSVSDVTRHEQVSLRIDADQRIVGANCTCNWHRQNRLRKGPCQHILALRMQHHQHEQDGHAIFWVN